jgi:hypothetical protein
MIKMVTQNELTPAEKNSGVKNIMLYPNCSEMTFRIGGDFEDIRKQMYNIIEWTRMEYTGEVGDYDKQKLRPNIKKGISQIKKQIKDAKTLEDFEKIVIDFTCNYETFFKADENGNGLLVATCNNYTWDIVDKQDEDQDGDDYYDIAGFTKYKLIDQIEGCDVFKLEYDDEDHKKFPMFVFTKKDQGILNDDYDTKKPIVKGKTTQFVIRNKLIYTKKDNHLIKVEEIEDKVLLNKIKILANLGAIN